MEWGKFRLGWNDGLFEVRTVKGLDEWKLNLEEKKQKGYIEFIWRTKNNNWIKWYLKELEIEPNPENVISVSQIWTIVAQIRNKKWYASQNIFSLTPKGNYKNIISLYIISAINKSLSGSFSDWYWNYPTLDKLKNLKISLPTKNWKIDFDFMESFIAELEAEKIAELNNYLKITWLKDYTLTSEEEKVLRDFESGKFEWWEFRIWELFDIATWRDVIIWNVIDWNIPLISHQHENNWITKRIEKLENRRLFNFKDTLSLADRGVFLATTQNEDFHIWTRVKALKFRDWEKNIKNRLFFVSAINKLQILFTEYSKNATGNLPNLSIKLPKKGSEPDFELMEVFVWAVQKMVVKDLVEYVEERV